MMHFCRLQVDFPSTRVRFWLDFDLSALYVLLLRRYDSGIMFIASIPSPWLDIWDMEYGKSERFCFKLHALRAVNCFFC